MINERKEQPRQYMYMYTLQRTYFPPNHFATTQFFVLWKILGQIREKMLEFFLSKIFKTGVEKYSDIWPQSCVFFFSP